MSDPISTLADQLLALINSKPQSPSKAEIEELIRAPLTMLVYEHHHRSLPLFFVGPDGPPLEFKWSAPNDFTNWNLPSDLNEESLERALVAIQSHVEDREKTLNSAPQTPPSGAHTCARYGHKITWSAFICATCDCGARKP